MSYRELMYFVGCNLNWNRPDTIILCLKFNSVKCCNWWISKLMCRWNLGAAQYTFYENKRIDELNYRRSRIKIEKCRLRDITKIKCGIRHINRKINRRQLFMSFKTQFRKWMSPIIYWTRMKSKFKS